MSGRGDMPEQKVNKVVKELNYHNMLVMIAVGDKTINNIGSICMVAEKWGLSYSIIQRAILGINKHCQGGRQYDKITGCPQRRSRCRQDKSQAQDKLDQEVPPTKKSKTGKRDNIRTLQEQNLLQQDQIIELTHYLNITCGHVSSNGYAITNLQVRMAEVNKTLIATLSNVKFVKYSVAIINDIRTILAKLTLGVMSLEQNINAIYEYLRVLSSKQVNPLIIPPDSLRKVLAHVKEDMKRNPRLQLPEDPNINIWNYYSIMKVTPIVMDDFLLIILTIPLTDQSLEMDLYKIYNLPVLHSKLKVEFTYELQGEHLAITKNKLYAALPTAGEIRICKGTEGYLCLMNQALYLVEKIEWCAYALFTQNEDKKRAHCTINTQRRDANKAQSLEGYLWVVTTLNREKMQIKCLTDTHVIDVRPPLIILYVGNGCEAYSSNLFIPARSELTSKDNAIVRHTYFQQFNEDYQNITRYSLIEDLELVKLTKKEIENLPDHLTALPNLQFKELRLRNHLTSIQTSLLSFLW